MTKFRILLGSALLAATLLAGGAAFAQEGGAPPGTPTGPVPPGEEIKALALAQLKLMGPNIVEIAKDMPADKLGWNPGMTAFAERPSNYASHDYGRSFANLCLHLSNLTFTVPTKWGAAPAADTTYKMKGFEDSTTDREKLMQQLSESFTYAQAEIAKLSVADLNKTYKNGAQGMTTGNAILATYLAEINDYFGQAKAYAHVQTVVGTDPGGFHPYQPK